MPCTSDYPIPSSLNRRCQDAARQLIYVHNRLGMTSSSTLRAAAKDEYCRLNSAKRLCQILNAMTDKARNEFIYGDPKDRQARDLATWWENHQRADRERERITKLKSRAATAASRPEVKAFIKFIRTAKLTKYDWENIEPVIRAAVDIRIPE